MADAHTPAPADSASELADLLNRMLVERLKAQETEAIEAFAGDPAALERYRQLQARRRELEASLAPDPAGT
jgi:DNA primase